MYQNCTPDTISLFDLIGDVPGHFLRITRTMLDISFAIEDAAAQVGDCHMFVSFQRFSRFRPQMERYRRLSERWAHCWVFGVPDTDFPVLPNVTPVPIAPDSPLAYEWFVVADGPRFGSALLTADTSAGAILDRTRRYAGLWTADPAVVRRASTSISDTLQVAPPTWNIDPTNTLHVYDQIVNQFLVVHEERTLTASVTRTPTAAR